MGRGRRPAAAIAALAVMLGSGLGTTAVACSMPPPLAESFASASAVVIAHAVKAVETRVPDYDWSLATVTIRAKEILKGRLPLDGAVLSSPVMGMLCGELLLTGRDYAIFIDDSPQHRAVRVIELRPGRDESVKDLAELRALARQGPQ